MCAARRRRRGSARGRTLGLLLTALLVMAAGLWWAGRRVGGPEGERVRVLVPAGASFREAADSLGAAGLIVSPRAFGYYARFKGRDRTIRAGTYELQRGSSWDALIDALHTGKGVVAVVTIPEGWLIRQMIPVLARALDLPRDSLEAAVRDSALRARVGTPVETLEGYLFPDTYTFALGTTARQAVAAMVARFERAWQPAWDARLTAMGRTRHEVVTMASIVEREVRKAEEHPVVAAVYWNRLRIGMPLQADPTVIYALGRSVSRVMYADLTVRSPYNTYRNPGLPPGPIAAPGAAALEGSLYPAQVPYRYFVAHPDGHHEFRTTYREHLEAVREVRALARADSIRRAALADSVAQDSAARDTVVRDSSGVAPVTAGADATPDGLRRDDAAPLLLAQVGPQHDGVAQVGVAQVTARTPGVHVQQHADAARQGALDAGLLGADHGDVAPAHQPRPVGGELAGEVLRDGEQGADHVVAIQAVEVQQLVEQLLGGVADLVRVVGTDGDGATNGADGADGHG
jgi:UPF0755 protein